jgi:hypothetical protein
MDAQPSFQWFVEVPSRAITKTVREQWQEYTSDCESEKGLVQATTAAKLLGVNRSRVYQLLQEDKLTRFDHFGHQWLSCQELMHRLSEPADIGGRPRLAA